MPIDATAAAQEKRRKLFGRAVKVAHGRGHAVKVADNASRNAYRCAIGLPPVTIAPTRHRK